MGTITQHEHRVRRMAEGGGPAARSMENMARRSKQNASSPVRRVTDDVEPPAPSAPSAEAVRRHRPATGWEQIPDSPRSPRKQAPAAEPDRSPVRFPTTLAHRYRLGRRVAVGGASAVYRAVDLRLGRPVAVKVLTGAEQEPECADRFDAETSLHAGLRHPRLVPLLDAGREGDRGYLVMPLVEGPTLADLVHAGPVDPREVRRIGAAIAEALAYVHAHDVVHRDVKPANVLLDRHGRVYLADFGAAHNPGTAPLVPPGMVIGTAGYLAPEQALGQEVSPACDMFALGLVLLEALTGEPEYTGTVLERAAAAVTRPPRIPDGIGAEWASLLRSLTAREPERRPDSGMVRAMLQPGSGAAAPAVPEPALLAARAA